MGIPLECTFLDSVRFFFFRRWAFPPGRLRRRSPTQDKASSPGCRKPNRGEPGGTRFHHYYFFPLTLSERSVCPLLDKTPKVRSRTVFAPAGAPPRRTGSIVPDT